MSLTKSMRHTINVMKKLKIKNNQFAKFMRDNAEYFSLFEIIEYGDTWIDIYVDYAFSSLLDLEGFIKSFNMPINPTKDDVLTLIEEVLQDVNDKLVISVHEVQTYEEAKELYKELDNDFICQCCE